MSLQETVNADIEALVLAEDWPALRAYFAFYDSLEQLACKVVSWGRFFLPTFLRDATPDFHYELIRRFFSPRNEYTACPRGFGKTTINQLCICYSVAHKMDTFIVVVEKSFTEAAEVIAVPRDQFSTNGMIRQVYGELVKKNDSGVFDDKNKDAQGDVFINGVRLRGKGFNAPIRGLKSAEWRPSRVVVDDVESDEHIGSDEQRRKYRENYTKGILPALDVGCFVKVTGTILHHDSLLQNLIDNFDGLVLKAYEPLAEAPEKTLLWPTRWTWARLMEKKEMMEMDGKGTSAFFQEYLNQPVDELQRDFRMDWLRRFWSPSDLKTKTALFRTVCIDPAESKSKGADYTAVTVVDTDMENNWFVRFVKRYRVNSAELIELIFTLHERFKPQVIGIERKAFEDQIKPYLDIKSQETGVFFAVRELEHGGQRKEDRVRGFLQGRFENGKIWFQEDAQDDTRLLIGELMDFPFGKNDDLCLAPGTLIATPSGHVAIEKLRSGDEVITPVGVKKILSWIEHPGELRDFGWISATRNHPVFIMGKGFEDIDSLDYHLYDTRVCLKLNTLIHWGLQSLLSSMDGSLRSWEGKESIISLSQKIISSENILKDYMLLFGSFLMEKKFLKAFMSIIKTAIHLITILKIWSVFQLQNIFLSLKKLILKNVKGYWMKLDLFLLRGMARLLGYDGTRRTLDVLGKIEKKFKNFALFAVRSFFAGLLTQNFVPITAGKSDVDSAELITSKELAFFAQKNLMSTSIKKNPAAHSLVQPVYNILVEDVNCYFANGFLVGNCDSLSYHAQIAKRPYGGATQLMSGNAKEFFDMKKKNRYGSSLSARL